jgi:hypothetical protein
VFGEFWVGAKFAKHFASSSSPASPCSPIGEADGSARRAKILKLVLSETKDKKSSFIAAAVKIFKRYLIFARQSPPPPAT